MREVAITLIEQGNSEAPNIGTVISDGIKDHFDDSIRRAVEAHFDNEVLSIVVQDGLQPEDVKNSSPLDAVVKFKDGYTAIIEIQQTWIY